MRTSTADHGASSLRTLLLLGSAFAASAAASQSAFAMGGSPVPVGCVAPDGGATVLNCSGNLSAGVPFTIVSPLFSAPFTINVFGVTKDITPDGVPGIALSNVYDAAIINSNTGTHRIITTDGAPGIFGGGATVSITHTGDIIASGFGSYGIFALGTQCTDCDPIGGQAVSPTPTVQIVSKSDITVGTSGGGIVAYATTGDVTVNSTGNITGGHDSVGILAANNGPDSKFGAFGSGDVSVVSKGNITLTEAGANQTGEPTELSSYIPPYRAGIEAYNGGTGNISVTSTGNISTTGKSRYGIDAYSAGIGTVSTIKVVSKGNISTTGEDSGAISAIGTFSDVTIISEGSISTQGNYASGLRASSGGSVDVTNKGDITVNGTGTYGIYATSELCGFCELDKGGPAAIAASPITITSTGDIKAANLGAGIAASSMAGDVSVTSTGNISGGYQSSGIVAATNVGATLAKIADVQHGNLSVVSTGNITLNQDKANQHGEPSALAEVLPPYNAGILAYNGGQGSTSVSSTGNIWTSGLKRSGIDVYSGGTSVDDTITVTSRGNITTTGEKTSGISAESESGDVEVSSKGNITTTAENTEGIYAVSHQGGFVDVINEGNITSAGGNAYGIMVAGYSDLTVTVKSGTVLGGLASVVFFAGDDNLLTNYGTVTAGAEGIAVEGDIIGSEQIDNHGTINGNVELATDPGDDWSGLKFFAQTEDSFHNFAGAHFNMGTLVSLGNNGLLLNEGTLNPGGSGVAGTTKLEGRLQQSASGTTVIDIDGKTADRIDIADGFTLPVTASPPGTASPKLPQTAAILAGTIAPHVVAFDSSKATQQFTIITAAGTITTEGLAVTDTVLADYTLLYPNEHQIVLQLDAHFTAVGLTPNQNALLGYLGRQIGTPGASAFNDVYVALLNTPDTAGVGSLADQLNTAAGASAFDGWLAGDAFAQALRSCPVAEGPYGQLKETSCIWARPGAREFNQSAGTDRADVNSNTSGIMGGIQTQVREDVWAGIGFSVEDTTATVNHRTQTDGTWWQAGAVVKWANGPWKLSGSVSGGQGNIDMTRLAGVPVISTTATSGTDVTMVTSLARLAYSFGATGLYVTPMLDVSASHLSMDGFTETGAGIFNLAVESADQWIFAGGPAVEVGTTIAAAGMSLRPYLKAGLTFLSESSFDIQARFATLPAGAGSFAVQSRFDDVFATLDAGVQLFSLDGINLKLDYQGRYGGDSFQNGVNAKLTVNY